MQNEMRNRLVNLINQDNYPSPFMCSDKCKYAHLKNCLGDRLADHLIENGVIVPPCKAGDVVYIIGLDKKIEKHFVEGICLYQNGLFVEILYNGQGFSLPLNKVFLTKSEAEQKLKGGADNG